MKIERLVVPGNFKLLMPEIKALLMDCYQKKKKVHVLIEPEKKLRSTGDGSQSHHLNGHIQQIARETGQPFEDIKKYVKQQAISMGYPIKEQFGNPVLDMWGNLTGISEADCSVSDCALLIDQAHLLAAELGIVLKEENGNEWDY